MQKKISETLSKKNLESDSSDKKLFELEHQVQMLQEEKLNALTEKENIRKELSSMKDELKKKVN